MRRNKLASLSFEKDKAFSVFFQSITQNANDFNPKIITVFIISLMQMLSQRAQTIPYQKEVGKSLFSLGSDFLNSRNATSHKFTGR